MRNAYVHSMTDEETIAWLSQPRAQILSDGVLSLDEVAEAVTAYLGNGLELFEEALLLCAHKKVPRAAALGVLGLEEIAKIPWIIDTFLRFEHGVERDAWTAYWKTGGSHKTKQALILSYGQEFRKIFDGDPILAAGSTAGSTDTMPRGNPGNTGRLQAIQLIRGPAAGWRACPHG